MWISEQTAIISLYNINWLVCITETQCVYCAVRTAYWNIIQDNHVLQRVNCNYGYVSCSALSFMNQVRMLISDGWPLPAPCRCSHSGRTHVLLQSRLFVRLCWCLQLKVMSEQCTVCTRQQHATFCSLRWCLNSAQSVHGNSTRHFAHSATKPYTNIWSHTLHVDECCRSQCQTFARFTRQCSNLRP